MLGLTLAQMRRSIPRLVAAGLAVVLGTAFVTATLLAAGVLHRTTYDAIAASYADADFVVSGAELMEGDVAPVAAIEGVAAADGTYRTWLTLSSGGRYSHVMAVPVASHPQLEAQELVEGTMPTSGGVALPVAVAERLGVELGETVELSYGYWVEDADVDDDVLDGEWVEQTVDVAVSGIVADPRGAFLDTEGAAIVTTNDARRWSGMMAGETVAIDNILVALAPGTDVEVARADIEDTFSGAAAVRTRDEHAEYLTAERSGATNLMTAVVLGFAGVAMVVAGFVIANTFAVLVAQRTRTLAMLRCVGASRRQLGRAVTTEALLLGVVASIVGVIVGSSLAQVALSYLSGRAWDVPLPPTITITLQSILVPLLVGTAVALFAARAPARAAGRVAPMAALRPADAPAVHDRGSRTRLVVASVLTVGGLGFLALGMAASVVAGPLPGVAIGVLGGALSFAGILVGAVFWMPRVMGAMGSLVARVGGPATALAAANTVRNPRRTAATSSALLIGVTLVTMMSTGAASARQGLTETLDEEYPVDVEIQAYSGNEDQATVLTPQLISALLGVDGVDVVAPVTATEAVIRQPLGEYYLDIRGVSPADARAALRNPTLVDALDSGVLLVPSSLVEGLAVTDGDTVVVTGTTESGEILDEPGVELTVRVADLPGWSALAAPETVDRLAPGTPVNVLWLRVDDPGAAFEVTATVREELAEQPVGINGAVVERAAYDRVIDTMLVIVVGLLGVAVVIALVGVTNTLSLAVIERRRESATLRAVGLTRRGLRRSLAVEGVLITAGGSLLGIVLGTLYGWAGAWTVVGAVAGRAPVVVAWRDVAIMLVVALIAGLLASVLPARRAVRASPVAALGAE